MKTAKNTRMKYPIVGILLILGIVMVGQSPVLSSKNRDSKGVFQKNAPNSIQSRLKGKDIVLPTPEKDAALELKVATVTGAIYTTEDIPLDIVFHNRSKKLIRLLNSFNNPAEKRVFFTVTLSDSNDSPLFARGGGKIDIARAGLRYIELEKDEKTAIRINLADFLPPKMSLEGGVYNVSVVYRNQYGEDCFKGSLESDPLNISLSKL